MARMIDGSEVATTETPDAETVWTQYSDRLRSFLQRRVANPADVDDLLQDISVKVLTGLGELRDSQRLAPWLFQTARHTIMDHYRRNARERAIDADELRYHEDEPGVRQELERCVEPFIRALPPDTAGLLTAIDLNGVSQRDLAAELGIPYTTLKSRVRKGRSDLRRVFDNCCRTARDARGNLSDYQPIPSGCKTC